jgi:hypothetical protein
LRELCIFYWFLYWLRSNLNRGDRLPMTFPGKTAAPEHVLSPWAGSSPSDARLLALLGADTARAEEIPDRPALTARRVAQTAQAYVRSRLLLAVSAALVLGFLGGCAWERH